MLNFVWQTLTQLLVEFPHDEFTDMTQKGQWAILSASDAKDLPGLWVSSPGVIPQRERRRRCICDYSWSSMNDETLPLAAMEAMKFGHALDQILREIIYLTQSWAQPS